eukprot:2559339-Prymnesium_polylepis.1
MARLESCVCKESSTEQKKLIITIHEKGCRIRPKIAPAAQKNPAHYARWSQKTPLAALADPPPSPSPPSRFHARRHPGGMSPSRPHWLVLNSSIAVTREIQKPSNILRTPGTRRRAFACGEKCRAQWPGLAPACGMSPFRPHWL